MNIKIYDNKLVRITDRDNNQYEGICYYHNKEFNECEYGIDEESLDIICIKFYKSDIKKVDMIDRFSKDYDKLEELIVSYGDDLISEVFDSNDNVHIYRLLLCIVNNNIKVDKELLLELLKNNKEEQIIKIVKKILEK